VRVAPAVGLENTAPVPNGSDRRETTRTNPTWQPLATVRDVRGRSPGRYSDTARAYLEAGAAGVPCAELAVELARAVLSNPDVQLAREVLKGGAFAHARATEFACRALGANVECAAVPLARAVARVTLR